MRPQYTTAYFADISTREACTVTRKLDLDQTWKELTRTLKTMKAHFFLQIFSGNMSMQLIGVPLTHIQQLKLFPFFSDVRMIKIVRSLSSLHTHHIQRKHGLKKLWYFMCF